MFGNCGHDAEIQFLRKQVERLTEANADLAMKLALIAEPALASRLIKRPDPPPDAPQPVNGRRLIRNAAAFRTTRMDIPPANVFLTPDPRTPEA
jgi:hypothetical protein